MLVKPSKIHLLPFLIVIAMFFYIHLNQPAVFSNPMTYVSFGISGFILFVVFRQTFVNEIFLERGKITEKTGNNINEIFFTEVLEFKKEGTSINKYAYQNSLVLKEANGNIKSFKIPPMYPSQPIKDWVIQNYPTATIG